MTAIGYGAPLIVLKLTFVVLMLLAEMLEILALEAVTFGAVKVFVPTRFAFPVNETFPWMLDTVIVLNDPPEPDVVRFTEFPKGLRVRTWLVEL
jgi:hypothetical protein